MPVAQKPNIYRTTAPPTKKLAMFITRLRERAFLRPIVPLPALCMKRPSKSTAKASDATMVIYVTPEKSKGKANQTIGNETRLAIAAMASILFLFSRYFFASSLRLLKRT